MNVMDVVTRENAYLYAEELDELFQLRHRYFVDTKHWTDLHKVDGRERDQFDNDDTIYLLLMHEGRVVGTHRLLPTTKPHLFTEVFPHLCNVRGIRRGPDIYEAGRTCLDESFLTRDDLRRLRRLIMLGLFESCARAGISQFVTLCPVTVVHQYLKMGLDVEVLGVPEIIDGVMCVAASFPTSEHDLQMVRAALRIHHVVVRYIGVRPDLKGPVFPSSWSATAPSMTLQ